MIQFLEMLTSIFNWSYAGVFFWMIHTFLPLRKNRLLRIAAFFASSPISFMIIYSNDLANLLGALFLISAYIIVFHEGHWAGKLTAVLVFYPSLIAVNYLTQDIGSRFFFFLVNADSHEELAWTHGQQVLSTAIYMLSQLLRLLFWILSWQVLRRYLRQITANLTVKMWLIVDCLMTASFVAIFTIVYFMPENPWIVYPICVASIFSSFGCIYLAAYICVSMQTEYYARQLEMKQEYYKDRMSDEARVRSIYHDLKNHLLLLQSQSGNGQDVNHSVSLLQEQIQEYENYYHTGNEFLDIIIRDKARAAQAGQIDFSAVISFADGDFIEPLDISTIFGNALDNAIEASEKLPEDRRLVTVKASHIRNMMVISVENNTSGQDYKGKGTSKKDTFAHGFGLPNIKNAVQKYGGQCSTKLEDDVFALKIVIPVP